MNFVTVRLYYDKNEWINFIKLAVIPFLSNHHNKKIIMRYYFYLSLHKGSNITLVLELINSFKFSSLNFKIIREFFKEFPSNTINFDRDLIFNNFPNNSIQIFDNRYNENKFHSLTNSLHNETFYICCKFLVTTFSRCAHLNDGHIVSELIKLEAILIFSLYPNQEDASLFATSIYKELKDLPLAQIDKMQNYYSSKKKSIAGFFGKVWNNPGDLHDHLYDWKMICLRIKSILNQPDNEMYNNVRNILIRSSNTTQFNDLIKLIVCDTLMEMVTDSNKPRL